MHKISSFIPKLPVFSFQSTLAPESANSEKLYFITLLQIFQMQFYILIIKKSLFLAGNIIITIILRKL
jgi:hypothetical protein